AASLLIWSFFRQPGHTNCAIARVLTKVLSTAGSAAFLGGNPHPIPEPIMARRPPVCNLFNRRRSLKNGPAKKRQVPHEKTAAGDPIVGSRRGKGVQNTYALIFRQELWWGFHSDRRAGGGGGGKRRPSGNRADSGGGNAISMVRTRRLDP